jgi:CDP-diglyceride synthetase
MPPNKVIRGVIVGVCGGVIGAVIHGHGLDPSQLDFWVICAMLLLLVVAA